MLFMGQEWAASSPFLFFTDHEAALGELVIEGRRREFVRFSSFGDPAARERIPSPQAERDVAQQRARLGGATRAARTRTCSRRPARCWRCGARTCRRAARSIAHPVRGGRAAWR